MALDLRDDPKSQRTNWRAERIGWGGLLLIIVAALLGLTGNGPLSVATVGDAPLRATYDRIMRYGKPGAITLRIGAPATRDSVVHVWASAAVLRSCAPTQIVPTPERVVTRGDRTTFDIAIVPGADSIAVRFNCEPDHIGRHTGMIGVVHGPAIQLGSVVLP